MKKIILASLLMLVGSSAFAQATACDPAVTTPTLIPGTDNGSTFIRVGFNSVCSANSFIVYTDDNANQKLIAGGVSVKGANMFAGSTLGGAVKATAPCANSSCSTTTAAANAATARAVANNFGT